jgi:hypothetical protein
MLNFEYFFKKISKETRSDLTKLDQFKDFWLEKWDLPKMAQIFCFFGHKF